MAVPAQALVRRGVGTGAHDSTRATDVEELGTHPGDSAFARWPAGGGRGPTEATGSEVWRFLEPADVSLLAGEGTRTPAGGGARAPGQAA